MQSSKCYLSMVSSSQPSKKCQGLFFLFFFPSKTDLGQFGPINMNKHYVTHCRGRKEGSGLIKSLNEDVTK